MNARSCGFGLAALALLPLEARALDPATAVAGYAKSSWTEKDGLPSSYIRAISSDSDGYIWVGTDAGLVRFDGVRFVRWEPPADTRLAGASVSALALGRDGNLWIAFMAGGVGRLRGGELTYYRAQRGGPPSSSANVIFESRDGAVWLGSSRGLFKLDGQKWERAALDAANAEQVIWDIHEDRNGDIWIAAGSGVFRKRGREAFRQVPAPVDVRSLGPDASGTLWVTTHDHALVPLAQNGAPSTITDGRSVNGWRVLRDREGNLWAATLGMGLFRIRAHDVGRGSASLPRIEQFAERHGLTNDVVRAIWEDREGSIWIGTQNGLTRISDSAVIPTPGGIDPLISQPVRAVTVTSDGSVWVGTNDGLYRFTGALRRRYGLSEGLPNSGINALHGAGDGSLYVATEGGQVSRFWQGRFTPVRFPHGFNRVIAMTTDQPGGLWLSAADKGVLRWTDGVLTAFADSTEVARRPAQATFTDSGGRVWLGFDDGRVLRYDRGDLQTFELRESGGSMVAAFGEDRRGRIWAGTKNGISRFDTTAFVSLSPERFPVTNVSAIVEDHEGYLWLGVGAGVVRVNPDDLEKASTDPAHTVPHALYDRSDGLAGAPGRAGFPTAARARDGTLWFVTSNGLTLIDPHRLRHNHLVPRVLIEDVTTDGGAVAPRSHLRLPSGTAHLQISYTALSFSSASKLRFRYMLEGFDDTWVEAGTRRQAFYTNLPPGTYRFRVGANTHGVWSESTTPWEFSLAPAFYQTGWFYALCAVGLVSSTYTAWRYRVRQLRSQFSAVLGERARMGRTIHDTLLQSLVGVALQFDDLSSKLSVESADTQAQCRRLRDQVELYIREARQSIWDLRSPTLEKRSLAEALRELGEIVTAGQRVRFEVVTIGTPRPCDARKEEQLLRIGQEALANAVRHSEARHVRIEIRYEERSVTLRVVDDGRGFDPEQVEQRTDSHWGLVGMRERAQQIGGRLRVTSEPGQGTKVETVTPL
jgi:signal transduction histidine kinase/ligand-binding sensor domain-containing protein